MNERKIGDVVVDGQGRVVLLTELDTTTKNYESVDIGISLRPKPGYQVAMPYHRRICNIADLLRIAEQHSGFDFKTRAELPDENLSEIDRLKKRIEALEANR